MAVQPDLKPRYWRAILKLFVVLVLVAGFTVLLMSAFQLGLTTGLAAAGGFLVVYAVPAAIFDWARLTLEDVLRALGALAAAIGAFFVALFDW